MQGWTATKKLLQEKKEKNEKDIRKLFRKGTEKKGVYQILNELKFFRL